MTSSIPDNDICYFNDRNTSFNSKHSLEEKPIDINSHNDPDERAIMFKDLDETNKGRLNLKKSHQDKNYRDSSKEMVAPMLNYCSL